LESKAAIPLGSEQYIQGVGPLEWLKVVSSITGLFSFLFLLFDWLLKGRLVFALQPYGLMGAGEAVIRLLIRTQTMLVPSSRGNRPCWGRLA
jgi:hypothetical protein